MPSEQERSASSSAGNGRIADDLDRVRVRPNTRLVERRFARGWTQEQVARAIADLAAKHGKTTGITANTVSRLERGYCTWPHTLVAEFECLFGCSASDLGFVNRRVGGGSVRHRDVRQDGTSSIPATKEALPHPSLSGGNGSFTAGLFEAPDPDIYSPMLAAYGTPQLYILANNEEYRRAFPGITVGTNLLEWAIFNPIAHDVLVEWDLETELLGNSMRQAASNPHNGEARAILRKCLDASPELQAIFDRGNSDVQRPYPYQLLRNPDSGEIHRVECNIWVAFTNGERVHFYIGKPLNERPPS
ncbi:helix-turn-helix domain-containing protein [Nocardia terpenica]|nr:helix-turn-helix transcriptional regulator [Nocardia terpenica]NQE89495.1 helix-turn-helix transcriptional regulator [Nocardia terpenica]